MQSSQLNPGEIIDGYRIVRKLGGGGMGEVYEAWEEDLQRKIAIKILAPNSLSSNEAVERFRGEGRALARLQHPNVVALYTLGEYQGRSYLALEFIDGLALNLFLLDRPIGLKHLLELFRQMTEGLGAAHAAGIIHRDLKPANIVIDQALNAKLVDFGIAKVYSDHRSLETEAHIVMGTANFLAPEVALGQSARIQSDIYSLGLVFYFMLTGENPFDGRNNLEILEKIRTEALRFNPRLDEILPDSVKSIVLKMTAKNLGDRFADTGQVLEQLKKVDLESLPADLRVSVFPKISLENADEVRRMCLEQGFATGEVRYILNLAAGIQNSEPVQTDATAPIEAAPKMTIGSQALSEAIERYRNAKRTMGHRRTTRSFRARVIKISVSTALAVGLAVMVYWRVDQDKKEGYPLVLAKIGQTESYLERSQGNKNLSITTLKKIEGGLESWVDGDGNTEIYYNNPFFPIHASAEKDEATEVKNLVRGDMRALFPLKPGGKSEVTVIEGQGLTAKEYLLRCSVGKEKVVSLTMGKMSVIEVFCERDRPPLVKFAYLYAPSLNRWVLMEESEGDRLRSYELITLENN